MFPRKLQHTRSRSHTRKGNPPATPTMKGIPTYSLLVKGFQFSLLPWSVQGAIRDKGGVYQATCFASRWLNMYFSTSPEAKKTCKITNLKCMCQVKHTLSNTKPGDEIHFGFIPQVSFQVLKRKHLLEYPQVVQSQRHRPWFEAMEMACFSHRFFLYRPKISWSNTNWTWWLATLLNHSRFQKNIGWAPGSLEEAFQGGFLWVRPKLVWPSKFLYTKKTVYVLELGNWWNWNPKFWDSNPNITWGYSNIVYSMIYYDLVWS